MLHASEHSRTSSEQSSEQGLFARKEFEAQMDRIWDALGVDNDTALARLLGKAQATVSAARTNKSIPQSWLKILNQKYRLSLQWILFGTGPMKEGQEKSQETQSMVAAEREARFLEQPGGNPEPPGLKISDDLQVAAKVLESGSAYALALHLNIQQFGKAVDDQAANRAMREKLDAQAQTLNAQAKTISELQDECAAMKKKIAELETQLARIIATGGGARSQAEVA